MNALSNESLPWSLKLREFLKICDEQLISKQTKWKNLIKNWQILNTWKRQNWQKIYEKTQLGIFSLEIVFFYWVNNIILHTWKRKNWKDITLIGKKNRGKFIVSKLVVWFGEQYIGTYIDLPENTKIDIGSTQCSFEHWKANADAF